MLPLSASDPEIAQQIENEINRQHEGLEMIASENFVSRAVLEAAATVFTNKYAEGYPGKRYYGGCEYADVVEDLARTRAKRLFNADHVNVQPHSGSQANAAAYMTLLNPGDCILGLDLAHGGHLTHGHKLNFSGKLYRIVGYQVRKDTETIDYDELEAIAQREKPRVIVGGGSAYPRQFDFPRMRAIADKTGAYLMVDMAHFAGLVADECSSFTRAPRARDHNDDAQNPAWAAQRTDPVPAGVLRRHRSQRLPRSTRRPVDPHRCGKGCGLQRGPAAGVCDLREAGRDQREGSCWKTICR